MADTPAGGTGTPSATTGGGAPGPAGPEQPKVVGITDEELPTMLRGKPKQEQVQVINNTFAGVRASLERIRQLETKLTAAEKAKESENEEDEPAPRSTKKVDPKKPLEEQLLEDAEGTIAGIVERRYGKTLSGMLSRQAKSELKLAKQEIGSEFDEYEEEIMEYTKNIPGGAQLEDFLGAYTMAVGRKALEHRRLSTAAADNQDMTKATEPTGGAPDQKTKPTEQEEEFRRGFRMSEEDWQKYNKPLEIKVPK